MRNKNNLKQLLKDEKGATAIEYGLIAALVAVAAIVAMTFVGTENTKLYDKNSTEVTQVVNDAIINTQ